MRRTVTAAAALTAVLGALHATAAFSQEGGEAECGSLRNPVGPHNYYSKEPDTIAVLNNVETNHFNQTVRSLEGGETSVGPMGDLDYVLRAFPNHPQALMLVDRYQASGGDRGRFRTAACYFDRALRFAPNDPVVHMMYGNHLARAKKNQLALEQYEAALKLAPEYAEAHYNIGLLLVKMGRLEEARAHAQKAYAAGYPLDGLRNQLVRAGAWKP